MKQQIDVSFLSVPFCLSQNLSIENFFKKEQTLAWASPSCYLLTFTETQWVNIGLAKKSIMFFFSLKDTFFIFTSNYWFGYFEYVAYIPHGKTLIVLN